MLRFSLQLCALQSHLVSYGALQGVDGHRGGVNIPVLKTLKLVVDHPFPPKCSNRTQKASESIGVRGTGRDWRKEEHTPYTHLLVRAQTNKRRHDL